MTFEIVVENPKEVFKMLSGKDWELKNGNLILGTATNIRLEKKKLLADGEITDLILFENYGRKAFVAGFPVKIGDAP